MGSRASPKVLDIGQERSGAEAAEDLKVTGRDQKSIIKQDPPGIDPQILLLGLSSQSWKSV